MNRCNRCHFLDVQTLAAQGGGHVVVKLKPESAPSAGDDAVHRTLGGYDVFILYPNGSLAWATWLSALPTTCCC